MPEAIVEHRSEHIIELRSPMVGTFFWAKKEKGKEKGKTFGYLGKKLKKGQIFGFINALRLDNEVIAPVSGTIIGIAVIDDRPVEYKQLITLIKTK